MTKATTQGFGVEREERTVRDRSPLLISLMSVEAGFRVWELGVEKERRGMKQGSMSKMDIV
jgi:hypothetical protein